MNEKTSVSDIRDKLKEKKLKYYKSLIRTFWNNQTANTKKYIVGSAALAAIAGIYLVPFGGWKTVTKPLQEKIAYWQGETGRVEGIAENFRKERDGFKTERDIKDKEKQNALKEKARIAEERDSYKKQRDEYKMALETFKLETGIEPTEEEKKYIYKLSLRWFDDNNNGKLDDVETGFNVISKSIYTGKDVMDKENRKWWGAEKAYETSLEEILPRDVLTTEDIEKLKTNRLNVSIYDKEIVGILSKTNPEFENALGKDILYFEYLDNNLAKDEKGNYQRKIIATKKVNFLPEEFKNIRNKFMKGK